MPWLALAALTLVPLQSLEDQERALREKKARFETTRPAWKDPAFQAWDAKYFDLQWDHLMALFKLAETRQNRDLWRRVVQEFTAFIWEREDYLAALQAQIHLARAHQALKEWGACFASLSGARRLEKVDARQNSELVEIATRSLIVEFKARQDYDKDWDRTLQAAEMHLKRFPEKAESESFLALRLERARALHRLRRATDSEKALREILARHPETDFSVIVLEALVDLFQKAEDALALAGRLYQRHDYTAAARLYVRASKTPEIWMRLGQCYVSTGRFHEAAAALGEACRRPSDVQLEAAVRLERVLDHLATVLKDADVRPRLDEHRAWMRKALDLEKAGPKVIRLLGDILLSEGKHKDALDLYAKLRPGQEGFEESLRPRAFCHYKLKEHERAVEFSRAYLAWDKRPDAGADGALDVACFSLLALGRSEDVLALTDAHRSTDPVHGQGRIAHRVDALARLGRFQEARETLATIDESVSSRSLIRALERLALGYEAAIAKSGDKALWGPYARIVVALSEKTFQPLRGEKLLAAADALSLEGTAEAYALAYDLYAAYLADTALRADERSGVEYRQAVAAAGSGKTQRAQEIAAKLRAQKPEDGSVQELQGDLWAAQAAALPPGSERNGRLDQALKVFAELSGARSQKRDEHYYRLIHKYASQLVLRDPEQAKVFFRSMQKRGWDSWDDGRWGYKPKMDALRDRLK